VRNLKTGACQMSTCFRPPVFMADDEKHAFTLALNGANSWRLLFRCCRLSGISCWLLSLQGTWVRGEKLRNPSLLLFLPPSLICFWFQNSKRTYISGKLLFPPTFQIFPWFRKIYVIFTYFMCFSFPPMFCPSCIYASYNTRTGRHWILSPEIFI